MGVQGVPAFLIDGELIVGFDKEKLEKLLAGNIAECPMCRTKHSFPEGKGRIRIRCSKCNSKFDVRT
jgi:glutaredoxin 3